MIEELLKKEKRYFDTRIMFYIGISIILWVLMIVTIVAAIPATIFTFFGVYQCFVLSEDYFFLRTIIREFKKNTLVEFSENYFIKTKETLSNSRTMVNKPKVYSKYGEVKRTSSKKYEMNLIIKINKIIKSEKKIGNNNNEYDSFFLYE